ncbi:MAG: cbb3-type cytochrome c oxidase subunit I [Limisphaerales bacterium]
MNANENSESNALRNFGGASVPASQISAPEIDASCRVPLLALFGGAAIWLVISSIFGLMASLTFHAPDIFANSSWLTYGHLQPIANDALLYGFCIPAGLGVALWLFAKIGGTPLRGALVPVVAANLWHFGVLVGLIGIFIGDSTGFQWLEFPRGSSMILFTAYLLIALWAMMNFAGRRERALQPTQWFLIAALFWFPWIYSTANLFLVAWPVRGVTQAVIGWWFADNLIFVWLALVGLGAAFYFLPKFSGRPLHTYYYALFAFWTLIFFGSSRGIPEGAPVPAWLPTLSAINSALLIIPIIAIATIGWKTVRNPANSNCRGGPFCIIKFGFAAFLLSALMLFAMACPQVSRVVQFSWFSPAQTQLQLYGFFAMTMFGAIYYLMPGVMGFALPFPKLVRVQHWFSMLGIIILVATLAIGGIEQGLKLQNPNIAFLDIMKSTLPFLRASTLGLLFILIGNLLFAVNIFAMTFVWKIKLGKTAFALVTAPLETSEVKA